MVSTMRGASVLGRLIAGSLPWIPRPMVYRVAQRYVAGVTLNDALATAARALAKQGLRSTTALLGEQLHDRAQVEATVAEYVRLLEALEREGLEGGVSVKPTHVGLSIDPGLCQASLERLATRKRRGADVSSASTWRTTPPPTPRSRSTATCGSVTTTSASCCRPTQAHARRHRSAAAGLERPPGCKGIYVEPGSWSWAATTRFARQLPARARAPARARRLDRFSRHDDG